MKQIKIYLTPLLLLFIVAAAVYGQGFDGYNDKIGDEFMECCKKKEISCTEVCTYPPPDFTIVEQWCMFKSVSQFIECYTGGHNNTKCCADRGVVGLYGICQDFCDGTTSHGWDPRYFVCGPVKEIISKCNHDSVKPPLF